MDYVITTLENLAGQTALANLTLGNYLMIIVGCIFLYLAIKKDYEPLLLIPIAFGMILVNIYPDIIAEPIKEALFKTVERCVVCSVVWLFSPDRLTMPVIEESPTCGSFFCTPIPGISGAGA